MLPRRVTEAGAQGWVRDLVRYPLQARVWRD